jgi:hypothetical protein
MYKEMKKIQTGNWSLINLFQLNRGRSILVGFKNKTKNNKKSLPTDPNFEDHAIGNTHIIITNISCRYLIASSSHV